jgi:hypothetical protein
MLCKWSLTWAHQSVLVQRLHAVAGLWPTRSDALSAICLYRTVIPQLLNGEGKALNSKSCVSMTITFWIIASRNYLVKWKKSINTDLWIQVAVILQYEREAGDWCIRSPHLFFRPDCWNLGKLKSVNYYKDIYEVTFQDSFVVNQGEKWNAD